VGGGVGVAGNMSGRRRGPKFHPGERVGMGRDHALFALDTGHVKFHDGIGGRKFISVVPQPAEAAE